MSVFVANSLNTTNLLYREACYFSERSRSLIDMKDVSSNSGNIRHRPGMVYAIEGS